MKATLVTVVRVEHGREMVCVALAPTWLERVMSFGRRGVETRYAVLAYPGSCRWQWMPPHGEAIDDRTLDMIEREFLRERSRRTRRRALLRIVRDGDPQLN